MSTITITRENNETYSSVSNFFIDYYMTSANGEFVKIYLYLVRLLNMESDISIAKIADNFNMTENDICRAIKYWISKDVLKLNYDGKGRPTGIVILSIKSPKIASNTDNDLFSLLTLSNEDKSDDEAVSNNKNYPKKTITNNITNTTTTNIEEKSIPAKPRFTPTAISKLEKDSDWADIIYQTETLFGKPVSQSDTNVLMYIYNSLNFDTDLIEYLIEYCVTMNKKNCRYMEAVAIAWYKEGIKTRAEAKEQASATSTITRTVFKALGIRRSYPTSIEEAYINTWTKSMLFSPDLIELACNKAIETKPASANFAYVNGILENWQKNGVKSKADVEALDNAFITNKSKNAQTSKSKGNSFSNFTQERLDDQLDEMEELLLKEVNHS